MSHVKSISVGRAPAVFLIPTVVGGKDIGMKRAQRLYESGKLKAIGGPFKTIRAADDESKRRSRANDSRR